MIYHLVLLRENLCLRNFRLQHVSRSLTLSRAFCSPAEEQRIWQHSTLWKWPHFVKVRQTWTCLRWIMECSLVDSGLSWFWVLSRREVQEWRSLCACTWHSSQQIHGGNTNKLFSCCQGKQNEAILLRVMYYNTQKWMQMLLLLVSKSNKLHVESARWCGRWSTSACQMPPN